MFVLDVVGFGAAQSVAVAIWTSQSRQCSHEEINASSRFGQCRQFDALREEHDTQR